MQKPRNPLIRNSFFFKVGIYFCALFFALTLNSDRAFSAQLPTLVYDAVTDPASGTFSSSIVFKGTRYISVTTPEYGTEIWTTDGTDAGTQLFKDIAPNSSASPIFYGATDDLLFFTAATGEYGRELWVTDGTVEGTRMVKDIVPGTTSGIVSLSQVLVGSTLYFTAYDDGTGNNIWRSDGTSEGTVQVSNMCNYCNDLISVNMVVLGDHIFFYGSNEVKNTIIKSDGTELGTAAMDIGTVTLATDLTKVGSYIYTPATDGTTGRELWRTDGTNAGTVLVKDINPGSADSIPANITNIDDVNFFFTATDATTGTELWKSDGTELGTVLVKDINPGAGSSAPANLRKIGSHVYFSANDGTNGLELWRTDGTELGTILVKDINPGVNGSFITAMSTTTSNVMYLAASDGTTGLELWKTDGTELGTVMVKDINVGSASSSPTLRYFDDGEMFFSAITDANGRELWKTDGTTEGTLLVKDITGNGNTTINLNTSSNSSELIFFMATSSSFNSELWKSDGTTNDTTLIKEIYPGSNGSRSVSDSMLKINDVTFFAAADGINGTELWKTDGTLGGTVLVKDIRLGSSGSSPRYFTRLGSNLIFTANNGTNGVELWKSDGTSDGTVMIKDIRPGSGNSTPRAFAVASSSLFFFADNGTNGEELWRTDGTADGTYMIRDVYSGSFRGVNFSQITSLNTYTINRDTFIFSGQSTTQSGLWGSDGTSNGTNLIKSLNTGGSGHIIAMTTTDNNVSYVIANAGTVWADYRLWKTDGTTEGTVFLKDLDGVSANQYDGQEYNTYRLLTPADTRIYFYLEKGTTTGFEIWTSDGTTDGTYMIKDINPGVASGVDASNTTYLKTVGDVAFFQGMDETNGAELWKTDGTVEGTYVLDIFPGPGSSVPSELLVTNNETELYMTAVSPGVGRELMRLPLTPTTTLSSVTTSSISKTGATVSTSITDVGFSPAHTRGFNYGTSLAYGMSTTTEGRYSLSTHEYTLSGLVCNTTYFVEAFAVNTYGTTTQTTSFTTSACDAVATPSSRRGGGGSRISVPVTPSTSLPTPVVPPTSSSNIEIFTRDLSFGSTGTDVLTLQRFLNSRGFTVSTTGPGSPGNEINVFGSRTQAALARFQTSVGITPASGYFGPITRSFVNALGTPVQTPIVSTPTQLTTPSQTTYTRDLFLGSRGSDVTQLQNFLIQQGYLESGFATGYFGQLTQAALIKFQQANNITPALGYFGAKTRGVVGK